MILVKDGKREPGHLDMQKLEEFCSMLPEVSRDGQEIPYVAWILFVDDTALWHSDEPPFRNQDHRSRTDSAMHS